MSGLAWVAAIYAVAIFFAGVSVGLGLMAGIARHNYRAGYDSACQRIAAARAWREARQ